MQREAAAERGEAGLCLKRSFGKQPVDRLNSFPAASRALQEQAQAPHSLQGYLAKDNGVVYVKF